MSSVFHVRGKNRLYIWLGSVAKEYLMAKRKRDEAAKTIGGFGKKIKELIADLERELDLGK
jgi:hypothetical protein